MTSPVRLPRSRRRDPPPPAHLSRSSKALWRRVLADYELSLIESEILVVYLEARDRATRAREAIERDGEYVAGRFGMKAHPALSVQRDAALLMLRSQRALRLPDEALDRPGHGRTAAAGDAG